MKKVLCLSRSYLSHLLPELGKRHSGAEYFHIVQTDREADLVRRLGGTVVLNLEELIREGMKQASVPVWQEPEDMREVTGFDWSPIYSDRYLPSYPKAMQEKIAGLIQVALARLFETHRFDGFLSEPVALFVTHLLLYHCRKAGTRPLLWCNTYFPGYFYFADGTDISVPVRRKPMSGEDLEELERVVDAYIQGVVADRAGPIYHHSFSKTKPSKLLYFKQRRGTAPLVINPGWTSRAIQLARYARARLARFRFPGNGDFMSAGAVNEHRFYLRCLFNSSSVYDALPETFSSDNVIFPLQFEPEASLLYFAPHIVSQVSFVETVLRALPEGKVLWVKEHPNQFGALGNPEWRALRKKYHNLRLVHGRQSGRELIKRSGLVVTISSTMGMDGLLLGRTVLLAGKVYYQSFSGVKGCRSYEELAAQLNDRQNYVPQLFNEANRRKLIEFGALSYRGDPQPSQYLFSDENLASLVYGIDAELSKEDEAAAEQGPQAGAA